MALILWLENRCMTIHSCGVVSVLARIWRVLEGATLMNGIKFI